MVQLGTQPRVLLVPVRPHYGKTYNSTLVRAQILGHDVESTRMGETGQSDSRLGDGGRDDGITQWDVCVDGIFIKQIHIPHEGTLVPQHVHTFDHHSMLAKGSLMVFVGDENIGVFTAPSPIFIRRGVQHSFLSMEKDVILYCIHNLHGEDAVDIIAEGKL